SGTEVCGGDTHVVSLSLRCLDGNWTAFGSLDGLSFYVQLVSANGLALTGRVSHAHSNTCGQADLFIQAPCAPASSDGSDRGSDAEPDLGGQRTYAWLDIEAAGGGHEAAAAQWACDWYDWQRAPVD